MKADFVYFLIITEPKKLGPWNFAQRFQPPTTRSTVNFMPVMALEGRETSFQYRAEVWAVKGGTRFKLS